VKRPFEDVSPDVNGTGEETERENDTVEHLPKRNKPNALQKAAPLAERMRPKSLDEVCGQELVGPNGVLRGLIESDRVPSMIMWGGPGTGKTSIARVVANVVGSRFVEINSTSTGVAECKKIFAEARNELSLTGRKTIIFCDEIHRFTKTQQDVFLAPVEAGIVTLIGATTENPSFKVQNALLSRCRTFTLQKLTEEDICQILVRAVDSEVEEHLPSPLLNDDLLKYLAQFADGDARTALNLLELSISLLTHQPNITLPHLKAALTKTLVYDRSGDQHYDTISAFHKSIRGSNPDAALYYLARMIASGEDALYIARRMIVMASEDIGLADNNMLPLAIAAYTACEKVGLPEARINLAHVSVALCLAPKSTRAYRGLGNAMKAIQHEPGVGGLPIPIHLRNAPTRLMKELGYGKEYKYNPNYEGGRVKQDYLPEKLKGRRFLEDTDLGTEIDEDLLEDEKQVEEGFDHSFHGELIGN
jgi:putative ATPase